jgi:LmbE family N-acetylglucosaminyl deacetylase
MILSQKSAMVFAPHQDDETLGCGGMIALKCDQNIPVSVVFLTDGKNSHPNHPLVKPNDLKEIRQKEAINALTILGVDLKNIHFLDREDGNLSKLSQEKYQYILNCLVQLLLTFKPQEVYVTYRHDRNLDHEASYSFVKAAILESKLNVELFQYPIWSRWYPWQFDFKSLELANSYRLPIKQILCKKKLALEAYPSQCLPLLPNSQSLLPPNFLRLFLSSYEIFFKN